MIKSFTVPSSNELKNIQLSAHSYIKFSNNVSALNVVSTLQNIPFNQQQSPSINGDVGGFDKSQLVKFSAGSNVKAIMASCFIDCYNLTDASFKGHIEYIGNYAFYGCSKLKNVSLLKSGHTANSIGDFAFAGTALEKIHFDAQNSSSFSPYLGKCIFANCNELKHVDFSSQNLITQQMFLNCTALTSVSFAKSTGLISQNAFENCTSLSRITMPQDASSVPNEFMKGCTNLTSFSFAEPGNLAYDQSLGNRIFEGTAIKSITFPASVSSFSSFSTDTLYGMEQLKEIHFNGMGYSQLTSAVMSNEPEQQQQTPSPPVDVWQVQIDYDTTKIYTEQCFEKKFKKHSFSANIINEFFIMKSASELCKLAKNCYDSNIPILCFDSTSGEECGKCNSFTDNILKNDVFKAFLRNNSKCVIILGDEFPTKIYEYDQKHDSFLSLCGVLKDRDGTWGSYVIKTMLWKKPNGVVVRKYKNNGFGSTVGSYADYIQKYIIDELNEFTADFDAASTGVVTAVTTVVNTIVTQTNCFGLNHSVQLFSKDGQCIEFESTSSGGIAMYNQQVQVDRITSNDFRYGQWYAKAQLVRRYADANYIPVLAIATQGEKSKQSIIFNNIIFDSTTFQTYIASKDMLLCKVDAQSFSSGNASYLLRMWMNKPSFKNFPLFMMYWIDKNGGIAIPDVNDPHTVSYDEVVTDFAYFSNDMSASSIDDVKCIHSSSELTSWIESLDAYKMYVPQDKFKKPAIAEFLSQYPKYKKYQNQANDDYGRYYPVKTLMPKSSSSYMVKVNDASNNAVEYIISPQSQPISLPPAGTYQYFSLLSTDDNEEIYDSIYQLSGLIFKVGNDESLYKIKEDSFSYNAKTYDAYLSYIGILQSNITKATQNFRYDLYLKDDVGNPTTNIDPDDTPPLWNNYVNLTLKPGTKVNGKNAYEVKLWLSSNAVITADLLDPDDKGLAPSDPQYVISAQVLGVEYSSMKLLWAREFNNA